MILGIDFRHLPSDGSAGAGVAHASREIANALFATAPHGNEMIGYAPVGASVECKFPLLRIPKGNRAGLLHGLNVSPCDALFVPSGAVALHLPVRTYPFVHDLDIFDHPEWFPQSPLKRFMTTRIFLRGLRGASHVFSVSEYTKKQILDQADVSESRITVVGEGGDAILSGMGDGEKTKAKKDAHDRLIAMGIREPFVLVLGTIEPRKNLPFILRTWASIAKDIAPTSLIIAGKIGWKSEDTKKTIDIARIASEFSGSRILTMFDVSESVRRALLLSAELVLVPSLSEGFGLVALEAIQAGTPVLVSDRGALPEIVGKGEWVIPLEDIHQWKYTLSRGLKDERVRSSWLSTQSAFISRWSWENSARLVWKKIGGG